MNRINRMNKPDMTFLVQRMLNKYEYMNYLIYLERYRY